MAINAGFEGASWTTAACDHASQNKTYLLTVAGIASKASMPSVGSDAADSIREQVDQFTAAILGSARANDQSGGIVVNVPAPNITVNIPQQEQPAIIVNVPEQAAPTMTVNVPEQPAPVVNVSIPAQDAPVVNVNVPKGDEFDIVPERDSRGQITRFRRAKKGK